MSAPAIRAVLLDGLGTLIALEPPALRLARLLSDQHGIAVTDAEAERAFAREMSYYREHHHEARDDVTLAELRARCAAVLADALPSAVARQLSSAELLELLLGSLRFRAQPDAHNALARLRERGLGRVVVSNWDCALPEVLRGIGLHAALDGVVTSGAVGRPKPAREIFDAALALAGVAPEEAVHVGDSIEQDVLGAHGAGIRAVLLRRDGEGDESSQAGSSSPPVIRTLDELPSMIGAAGRLGSLSVNR